MLVNYKNDFDFETETFKVKPVNKEAITITNLTDHLIGFSAKDYSDPADDEGLVGLQVAEDINKIEHGIVLVPHETRCIESNVFFDIPEINERSMQATSDENFKQCLENINDCIDMLGNIITVLKEASEQLNSEGVKCITTTNIKKDDDDLLDEEDDVLEIF